MTILKRLLLLAAIAVAFSLSATVDRTLRPDHTGITYAQSNTAACDAVMTQALELVAETCIGVGRNEICYGNDFISATLTDDSYFFDRPGDIVPVTAIGDLNTSSADPDSATWGVALMDVQADLPDSNEGVRILLFGGARLGPDASTAADLPTCTFTNQLPSNVNLRSGPGEDYRVFDVLGFSEALPVYGQTSDGAWLRSARGWIAAEAGDLSCSGVTLATMDTPDEAYIAPMQSFSLRVDEDARCEAVPTGMLIQTPTGRTANLMINNVELRIGSTALVTLNPENECQYHSNYDGNVIIGNSDGDTGEIIVPNGSQYVEGLTQNAACGPEAGEIQPLTDDEIGFINALTADFSENGTIYYPTDTEVHVPAAPSVELLATDETIAEGQCTYLVWTSQNAQEVFINSATQALNSAIQICPTETTTYEAQATPLDAEFDAATASVTVTVTTTDSDTEPAAPTLTVEASSETILEGDCAVLAWRSENAQAVLVGSTPADANDSTTVCPTVTTTYRLTALPTFAAFSPITTTVVIDVEAAALAPEPTAEPIAEPTSQPTCPDGSAFDPIGDPCLHDEDSDGILDEADACPSYANDTIGAPCNPDEDGDTILDGADNCPFISNIDQTDANLDLVGDACDPTSADLSVSATVDNNRPTEGDTVTVTFTVTNNGPEAMTGGAVLDVSMGSYTGCFAEVSPDSYAASDVPLLAVGASQVFTYTVDSGTHCTAELIGTVSGGTPLDPNSANDSATTNYVTTAYDGPDVTVEVFPNGPTPNYGDPSLIITVRVTNIGTQTATGASLSASLVAYNCTDGQPIGSTFGPFDLMLSPGQSADFPFTWDPSIDCEIYVDGGVYLVDDVNSDNNYGAFFDEVPQPNVEARWSIDPVAPVYGDTVTLYVSAVNIGSAPATDVDLTVTTTNTPCGGNPTVGSFDSLDQAILPGANITYSVTFDTTVDCSVEYMLDVTVGGPPVDTDLGNNSVTASYTVSPPSADLSISGGFPNPTPVVGYTNSLGFSVYNNGPDAAAFGVVIDITGTLCDGTPYSNLGSLFGPYPVATGASVGFGWGAIFDAATYCSLSATATIITPSLPDPNMANNVITTTTETQRSDLAVYVSVSDNNPSLGDNVTFNIVIDNLGPNDATGVQWEVTGTIGTCSSTDPYANSGTANIPAYGSLTLLGVSYTAGVNGCIVDYTATILNAGSPGDTNSSNNSDSDAFFMGVLAPTDLQATASIDTTIPALGDPVNMTLGVVNNGPNAVDANVSITGWWDDCGTIFPINDGYATGVLNVGDAATWLYTYSAGSDSCGADLTVTITYVSPPGDNTPANDSANGG